jgi:AbrB family looped-hinge helix DNA binding protein
MASAISSKGQVTIPGEVWRRLGARAGDRVKFVVRDGFTTIQPDRDGEENPFTKYIGALGGPQPDGTAVAWVREMRGPMYENE